MTRDHVPPKNLLSKPLPSDLVTVPSCHTCNESYKLDDEYFRLKITLGIDPEWFPIAVGAIDRLRKPTKRGLAKKVLSDLSADKRWSGVDRERVERVARRIVLGLFFHHTGDPLPKNAELRVWFPCFGDPLPNYEPLAALLDRLAAETDHRIGDGVFTYRVLLEYGRPGVSVWRLCFYEKNEIVAETAPPSSQ